jgi:thiol:disulfide interchange protein DsbD
MQSFKQLLAFPLYATAIWLLWITGRQTGVNGMAIALLGCLLLVFALWLWPQSTWKKIIAVLTAAIALALLASPLLDARQIEKTEQAVSYSPQQLQKMRNVGRPVFVNVTADWCITCIANESTALSSEKVLEAFRKNNIAYLKADWTNYDSDIAQLLKQYQRSGVPLYLLYPANSLQAPIMLPQLLTSNTVLDYIDKIQPKVTDF